MIEHKLYFGIVEQSLLQKDDHPPGIQLANRVRLLPLYCAVDDLSMWQPIENVKEEFPHNGFVTWFSPSNLAREGSLWHFHIKESFSFKKDNPRHDQYCVAESARPWPVVEVIVLWEEEHLYNAEIVRRKLVEDGIWLKFTPTSSVYFQVEENTVVGPIELVQKGDKWYAASAPLQQNSVRQYVFPEKSLVEISIHGAPRSFLRPKAQLGAPVRQLDWASDALVLKRVLRWLSNELSTDADTIKLTQSILDRAAALIQHTTEESGEATLHRYRLQRVSQLLPQLLDNEQLAQTLIEDLPRLPFVADETNKIIEQARQQALAEVSRELASEQQQLEAVRLQKAAMEAETAQIERRLAHQSEEIEQQAAKAREALEQAMAAQLTEIMNQPAEILAEIAVMRAALNLNAHLPNAPSAQLPPHEKPPAYSLRPPSLPLQLSQAAANRVIVLREQQELRRALDEEATGLCDAATLRTLHAAFLSGLVPVLAGSDAYEVLKHYAASAVGGRLLWLPVPATALEPADLLGKFHSTSMHFMPQPNGLLDLLLCAQNSEELFIVALDGINRASIDACLSPLLALYADAWQEPNRRRALPLADPVVLEQIGWEGAAHLTWPPNVLLAALWAEGAVSMPTPASFWNAAALIQVSQDTAIDFSAHREVNALISTIPLTVWRGWREQNQSAATAASSEVRRLTELLSEDGFSLNQRRFAACSKMLAAARMWLQSETDEVALHDVLACCFAPPLLAAGGAATLDRVVKQINKTGEDLHLRIKRADLLLS